MSETVKHGVSLFSDYDIHLFKEGRHFKLWKKMGSHVMTHEKEEGVLFSVWAPNAESVAVMGEFNGWNRTSHQLAVRWDESGIWEGFIPGLTEGELYKYVIKPRNADEILEKADPYARMNETPPKTASQVFKSGYEWTDSEWVEKRKSHTYSTPMSVYEIHLGSWRRDEHGNSFSYRKLAEELVPYLKEMGYTHVEFMPVLDHPFFGSWGYQVTGYFAPTSIYGDPDDLRFLIDALHKEGIGVILDWVPSHFPGDAHALKEFDGSHLYEHEDHRRGFHPDWSSYIFNYGRFEVKCFLVSSALFWLEEFHIDALRVDAVASMLYLDYSRNEGEWLPNEYGGNENLEAITFLKAMNDAVHEHAPGCVTIAEESTAWPKVSGTTEDGGLGFDYKWMMGWMHDSLRYFGREPIYRKYHQNELTFSIWYYYSEHFQLAFSHDEVVYGKGSMFNKMSGDDWHKFANLRLLMGYMFTHPGNKLNFMGNELAQREEWNHDGQLNWDVLKDERNEKYRKMVGRLNALYTSEKALHEKDFEEAGFNWTILDREDDCILCFERIAADENDFLTIVMNADQQTHYDYMLDVRKGFTYTELFNSDSEEWGGSGIDNPGVMEPVIEEIDGVERNRIKVIIPPLCLMILKPETQVKKS
jgi:1,4-alpha-glucan branching enzyme